MEKRGIEIKNEEKISLCPKYVEKIAKEALVSQAWPQKEAEAVGASAEVPNDLMEIQARAYQLERTVTEHPCRLGEQAQLAGSKVFIQKHEMLICVPKFEMLL